MIRAPARNMSRQGTHIPANVDGRESNKVSLRGARNDRIQLHRPTGVTAGPIGRRCHCCPVACRPTRCVYVCVLLLWKRLSDPRGWRDYTWLVRDGQGCHV